MKHVLHLPLFLSLSSLSPPTLRPSPFISFLSLIPPRDAIPSKLQLFCLTVICIFEFGIQPIRNKSDYITTLIR